ncbi:MAG: DUF4157 domain-containing protein [Methylococcaceae bacterium]
MQEPKVQRQVGVKEDEDEETIQTKPVASNITPLVQRQADSEDEEEELQRKRLAPDETIQRRVDEEETIQKKGETSRNFSTVTKGVESSIESLKGNSGLPLPENVRSYMEPRFGHDFSRVRIHIDRQANQTTKNLQASAFTLRNHIVFGLGKFVPTTFDGRSLLAHELVHTLQQVRGDSIIQRSFNDPEFPRDTSFKTIPSVISPRAESGLKKLMDMKPQEIKVALNRINDTVFLGELSQAVPYLKVSSALERLRLRNISASVCRRRNELGDSLVCMKSSEFKAPETPTDDDFKPGTEEQKEIDKAVEQAALTDEERKLLDSEFINEVESTENSKEFKKVVKKGIGNLKGEDRTRHVKAIMEFELAEKDLTIEKWFAGLRPDTTFLGRVIKPSTARVNGEKSKVSGVHKELAVKLAQAEERIISDFGCTSPKECGDAIGIKRIGGVRLPKIADRGSLPSLHVYGLAIDINGKENPRFSGEFNNDVVGRATKLVQGQTLSLIQRDNNKRSAEDMFNLLDKASNALKDYFVLTETANMEKLNDFVSKNGEGKSVDDVRKRIEKDKEITAKSKVLGGVVAGKRNIFNLPKDFVLAMVESGLKWGGNLKNPDVHHFDYRKGTISRR